jgi:hypothetical protein
MRWAGTVGLAAAAWVAASAAFGVADKSSPHETVTDRAHFIPYRNHQPLKGTVVGILVGDPQPILGNEGRYGPPDQMTFATAGNSYRWVYIPVQGKPRIQGLTVPLPGNKTKTFSGLSMANPVDVKQWGITQPYTLVEAEVNGGLGSPGTDGFVATKMKVLEGTKEYPIKVAETIGQLRQRYATYLKEQDRAIEKAMGEAQQKALKDKKPTGPREKAELMFITWLPEKQKLRVHFRTTINDGAYQIIQKAGPKLPPRGGRRPPPPRVYNVRTGTMYGVEFGMAYEVSKTGKVEKSLVLPFQAFQKEISVPFNGPVPKPADAPPNP